jgi:oligosaccharide repeat unit polymerase
MIIENKKESWFNFDLANPMIVYTIIWTMSFYLYSLEITTNVIGLNLDTILLVLGSVITFIIIYLISYIFKISTNNFNLYIRTTFDKFNNVTKVRYFEKITKVLTIIWGIGTFLEVLQFGGVPIISVVVLGHYDLDYKAFGLPTIHGMLNAIYLTVVVSYYIHFQITRSKQSIYKVILLSLWPLLCMTRALLLWNLIEILSVYLIFHKINFKKIISLFFAVLVVVLLFGYIGDNRGEASEVRFTDNFIKEEYREVGKQMPSGFIWVYMYLTTPINNVVWNVDKLHPAYDFNFTSSALIPSIIRDKIYVGASKYPIILYQETFNVSSYFANLLGDFGVNGALVFVCFLQIAVTQIYFSAKTNKLGSIVAYATIFNSVMMSVFFDFFFSLVTIFQVILGFFINYLLYSKSKKQHVQG